MSLAAGPRVDVRPVAAWKPQHVVELYETDEYLADAVSGFAARALRGGDAMIVVATEDHRRSFELRLEASGIDVLAAVVDGRYLAFDAAELLGIFMVDGLPEPTRFRAAVGTVVEWAGSGGRRLHIYGEMVALLWELGQVPAAIALEDLWNDMAASFEFSLLCAYPMRVFEDEASAVSFTAMCEQHTSVIPNEDYCRLHGRDARERAVARLQQETAALRTEVARLHAERAVLVELALVDPRTALANRRAFEDHVGREWTLARRDGIDSVVVVAHVHPGTSLPDRPEPVARLAPSSRDEVLRQVATFLGAAGTGVGVLGRVGPDEVAVLLLRCHEADGAQLVSRAREAMADPSEPAMAGIELRLGCAALGRSSSPAAALAAARRPLFAAFACPAGAASSAGSAPAPW